MASPPSTATLSDADEHNNIRPSGLPLSSIQEDTEPPSTGTHSRTTKSSIAWPFHTRNISEAASTTLSMKMRASWNPRHLLRMENDNVSISRSIVPDYILHYMAGETPESLAQKRQEREGSSRGGDSHLVHRNRDSLTSTPIEFVNIYSSSTDLTRSNPSSSQSRRGRYLSGWRGGLRLNAVLIGTVFLATLGCFLAAVVLTKRVTGEITVFSGSCSVVKQMNIGLHVALNIAAIGILAAGNYILQVLSSPSRVEIDLAHGKQRWLDIGIPSVRNFRHISPVRSVLASAAIVCAAASPVIYNGVIFETMDLEGPGSCGIHGSIPMLLTAAVLSFVVFLCTCTGFILPHFDPIVTIGDAIRSFLRIQDPTTADRCLMTKSDVKHGRWASQEARYFARGRHWWFLSASFTRWFLTTLTFLAIVAPATVAVIVMVNSNGDVQFPPIGTATPATTFVFPSFSGDPTIPRVILATLPHLLLSILYLSASAILTCYFLSHEFSLFARERQQLRVSSNPVSAQSSTLYLTLPRPVSWCLMALFSAMGVIMSQSVFPTMSPAATDVNSPNGDIKIGLSSTALLVLLGLLGLLLIALVGMGFLSAKPAAVGDEGAIGNPLTLPGGSCSAVISSRCHGRPDEDGRGAISWGVTEEARGMIIGHCAFSRKDVGIVEGRGLYA